MQVKLFWVHAPTRDKGFLAHDSGEGAVEFESQINGWLAQNSDVEIALVKQSACGGSFGPPLWCLSGTRANAVANSCAWKLRSF